MHLKFLFLVNSLGNDVLISLLIGIDQCDFIIAAHGRYFSFSKEKSRQAALSERGY